MTEAVRIYGWLPGKGDAKVPARIEYRYCPNDMMHWRVDGAQCPVCKAAIAVAVYSPDRGSPR